MFCSFVTLVKYYHVTYVDDDNKPFKINCQICNDFLTCAGKSGDILYIAFLHAGMSTIGIYPEDINTENFFFQCTVRTTTHHIYHRLLKEENGNHKYLMCPDI